MVMRECNGVSQELSINIAGMSIMRASVQPEYTRRSVIQKSRSTRLSLGRGCFRLKTASCCRRAAASNASLWRVTNKAWIYVTTAMTSEPIAPMLVEQRK